MKIYGIIYTHKMFISTTLLLLSFIISKIHDITTHLHLCTFKTPDKVGILSGKDVIKKTTTTTLPSVISSVSNQKQYIPNDPAKKMIYISPGGFRGIYMFGTCTYIKDTYNTQNFIFTGASAGAWNSLFMVCNKNILFDTIEKCIMNNHRILDIQTSIKKLLLSNYDTKDFDLDRLFISVATFQQFKMNKSIYYNFTNLEDAIDCCMASSHIPLITGGWTNKYNNILSFDGGYFKYPYIQNPVLKITPDVWMRETNSAIVSTTLFSKHLYNFRNLFENGYNDAMKNRKYLDGIFLSSPVYPI